MGVTYESLKKAEAERKAKQQTAAATEVTPEQPPSETPWSLIPAHRFRAISKLEDGAGRDSYDALDAEQARLAALSPEEREKDAKFTLRGESANLIADMVRSAGYNKFLAADVIEREDLRWHKIENLGQPAQSGVGQFPLVPPQREQLIFDECAARKEDARCFLMAEQIRLEGLSPEERVEDAKPILGPREVSEIVWKANEARKNPQQALDAEEYKLWKLRLKAQQDAEMARYQAPQNPSSDKKLPEWMERMRRVGEEAADKPRDDEGWGLFGGPGNPQPEEPVKKPRRNGPAGQYIAEHSPLLSPLDNMPMGAPQWEEPYPIEVGQSVQANAITPIGQPQSNGSARLKAIAGAVGGVAFPLILDCAIRFALPAAIGAVCAPAVAGVLAPLGLAVWSAYRLTKSAKGIYGQYKALQNVAEANHNKGMSRPAAFLAACRQDPFKTGLFVGSALLSIFTVPSSFDVLSEHLSSLGSGAGAMTTQAIEGVTAGINQAATALQNADGSYMIDNAQAMGGMLIDDARSLFDGAAPDAGSSAGPEMLPVPEASSTPDVAVSDPVPAEAPVVEADAVTGEPVADVPQDPFAAAPEELQCTPQDIENLRNDFQEHIEGDKVSADVKDSLRRAGSDSPHIAAQGLKDLGHFMNNGFGGVEMDKEKAVEYFKMAAQMDNDQGREALAYVVSLPGSTVENPYPVVHEHMAKTVAHAAETVAPPPSVDIESVAPAPIGGVLLEAIPATGATSAEALEISLNGRDALIEAARYGASPAAVQEIAESGLIQTEHIVNAVFEAEMAGNHEFAAAIEKYYGMEFSDTFDPQETPAAAKPVFDESMPHQIIENGEVVTYPNKAEASQAYAAEQARISHEGTGSHVRDSFEGAAAEPAADPAIALANNKVLTRPGGLQG